MSLGAALVLPSFPGSEPPDWIRRFLADGGRGIVLFSYNVDDLPALAASLRAEREDVLLALDEEGGDVTRLEWREGSSYPSAAALGALDEPALTEEVAAAIAADLAAAGVNWNFAPVADVNVPANPVIGVRSFGSDPALVARHVAAAVRGMQRVGVAACAKHFPGHGSTVEDSHLALPALVGPIEAGLEPFRAAIAAGVASIMTAHIKVNADAATLDHAIAARPAPPRARVRGRDRRRRARDEGRERAARRRRRRRARGRGRCGRADRRSRPRRARRRADRRGARRASLAGAPRGGRRARRVARRVRTSAGRRGRSRRGARRGASGPFAVDGDISFAGDPSIVELRPIANIAAGEAEHGLAPRIVREGEPIPDADVYVVRDVHRHPWMEAVDRPGAVVVEIGLPVWRPQRRAGTCRRSAAAGRRSRRSKELLST